MYFPISNRFEYIFVVNFNLKYIFCLTLKKHFFNKEKSVSLHRNSEFVPSVALIIIEKAAIRCSPSNEIKDDALILCAVQHK